MKRLKTGLLLLVILLLTVPQTITVQSAEYITIQEYVSMLEKATGKKKLVKDQEFSSLKKKITRVDAAVLTNRAAEMINGATYDMDLYSVVKNKKRITGLNKIPKNKIPAVRKVFTKGLMVGYSNGKYAQNRDFKSTSYLTKSEAKNIIVRLKDKKKRKKLSPDGQLIRTTKLPKNYKKYNYILASFPNSFYEKKFSYEISTYSYKPVELVDYARPNRIKDKTFKNAWGTYKMQDILDKNLDTWVEKVEINLNKRLNFNYKTVNNQWITDLRKTYYLFGDSGDQDLTKHIKNYVAVAKKNKVIVKSSKIVVEPSTLYYDIAEGYVLRCYVRFKVSADTIYTAKSANQHKLIYGQYDYNYLPGLKKNTWYDGIFDISLATSSMTSIGEDMAVDWDFLAK